jgi:hypothetical protein
MHIAEGEFTIVHTASIGGVVAEKSPTTTKKMKKAASTTEAIKRGGFASIYLYLLNDIIIFAEIREKKYYIDHVCQLPTVTLPGFWLTCCQCFTGCIAAGVLDQRFIWYAGSGACKRLTATVLTVGASLLDARCFELRCPTSSVASSYCLIAEV